VRGLRGPAPEKWPDDTPNSVVDGKPVAVLARIPLNDAEWALPLADLERRYPLLTR
jgi:hypothetical protein